MAIELVDAFLRHARDRRDEAAISTRGGSTRTWSDVARRAAAWAATLDNGTPPDATLVASVATPFDAWTAAIGAWASGRGFLPLPARVTDIERTLLREAAGDLVFRDAPDNAREARLEPARASSARLRLRTSGSTGTPRLVEREASAIDAVARTLVGTLDARDVEQIVSFLPPHHSYGIEHAVLLPIRAGMVVVTAPQFAPATLHELFASSPRATWPTTPSMLETIMTMSPPRGPARVYTAGARSVPSVLERFIQAWKVVPGDLYGASEAGTIAFAPDARQPLALVEGVEARIDEGEVLVRSDAMFSRYLPHDDSALRDGFFATGDVGRFEGAGLRIEGRLKLQFDVGGLKVNPIEVELHLIEHPAVREAVVVPQQMSASLLRAHAIVVPRDGAIDVEELRRVLRERLPAHMVPRTFEVREALPRTATGKIDRRALAACD